MPRKRKLIASLATSADGFIARRDGSFDFLQRPRPKGNYGMAAFYKSIDTILWCRKTCELALAFQQQGVGGTAFDKHRKHYRFTRTLPRSAAPAGVELVNEPISTFARRLRRQTGSGGAGLLASFLDAGEIDEFRILVIPILIGEGLPLLAPAHRSVPLTLLSCTRFADGVVRLHYRLKG